MQQLSPLDALFLYNETRNGPLHISPLMFYDVSTAPGGFVRFKDILRTFRSRLSRSPVFRRRLLNVPGNLGYPYWIEDADFDLEFHVRHLALPKPGDWRQFCILVSRLHSRPLDMSRPPWEAYIIEGLDNIPGLPPGSFAMYMKIHHSAIDGATGNQIVEALHDLVPDAPAVETPDPWQPERPLPPRQLLRRAMRDLSRQPLQAIELGRQLLKARSRVRIAFEGQAFASHEVNERIRFNDEITPHRVFGGQLVALDQLKAIKSRVPGATLNDAVLAVVGGAMRKYLEHHKELPTQSVVTAVPVSTRRPDDASGNQVSGMRLYLRTDVADPLERVRLIHEDAIRSKAYQNAVDARKLTDLSASVPSSLMALGLRISTGIGLNRRRPLFHTVVTNVPGPQVPMYMCGARMVWWFGAGALADGLGLFHTVNSYCGQVAIAYLSCRRLMPDPDFYDRCLRESFDELLCATQATPPAESDASTPVHPKQPREPQRSGRRP